MGILQRIIQKLAPPPPSPEECCMHALKTLGDKSYGHTVLEIIIQIRILYKNRIPSNMDVGEALHNLANRGYVTSPTHDRYRLTLEGSLSQLGAMY